MSRATGPRPPLASGNAAVAWALITLFWGLAPLAWLAWAAARFAAAAPGARIPPFGVRWPFKDVDPFIGEAFRIACDALPGGAGLTGPGGGRDVAGPAQPAVLTARDSFPAADPLARPGQAAAGPARPPGATGTVTTAKAPRGRGAVSVPILRNGEPRAVPVPRDDQLQDFPATEREPAPLDHGGRPKYWETYLAQGREPAVFAGLKVAGHFTITLAEQPAKARSVPGETADRAARRLISPASGERERAKPTVGPASGPGPLGSNFPAHGQTGPPAAPDGPARRIRQNPSDQTRGRGR